LLVPLSCCAPRVDDVTAGTGRAEMARGWNAMIDLGIFTVPLIGALSVFLVAFFTGDTISFDDIGTPADMQWNGYDSHVVTRMLMDHLREVNEDAQSEAIGLAVDTSYIDQSLGQYADYFGIGKLVDTTRNLVGANEYYVSSEITDTNGKVLYTARLFTPKSDDPVNTVKIEGDPANPDPMLAKAAVDLLTTISPYIVALHYFKEESRDKQWEFPKTSEVLRTHIENPPPDNNYLAYDLIGRMHRRRAEADTALTPEQHHQELLAAIESCNAALRQKPDFLYSNFTLAVVYAELDDYANSDRYFDAAVRIDPNFLPVREHWARTLVKRNMVREAVYQYVAAVEIAPEDPELRNKLADLYFKLNRADEAMAQWQVAEYLDPTNGQIRERLKAFGNTPPQ
jgi:tetratricopeptide (TPR) repeat protein